MRKSVLLFLFVLPLAIFAQGVEWGVATVDDPGGMNLNPGYLGLGYQYETALFGSFSTDSIPLVDITDHHGFAMNLGGWGIGYEHRGPLFHWSSGLGVGNNSFGIGYMRTWTSSETWGGGWRNGWAFGTIVRPWNFISGGWSYENTPTCPGVHRFGLGLRPTTWRVTLFADYTKPDELDWAEAYWGFGGELHLIDGIRLFGRYNYYPAEDDLPDAESYDRLAFGLRIDNPFGGIGAIASNEIQDEFQSYTVYSVNSLERLPSVIPIPYPKDTYLKMTLSGNYEENPQGGFFGSKGKSFGNLIRKLDRVADDNQVHGLVIKYQYPGINFAQAEELRRVLERFKDNDKEILLFAEDLGNLSYYVASVADYIVITPTGSGVNLIGLRAEMKFFKGTLDKVGVKADFVQMGKYKSAMEMFTRTEPTEPASEEMEEMLDGLHQEFIDAIAYSRELDEKEVGDIIDNGPYTDLEAIEKNLVDTLLYWDEFEEYLDDELDIETESFNVYTAFENRMMNWGEPDRIAVVFIDGNIVRGRGGSGGLLGKNSTGNKEIVAAIDAARRNKSVKGILIRVDSGGGSAIASDLMARAISRAAEKKPVVVSMGGAAASGGYYVSAPAAKIFADNVTITGSIGVISGKFSISGLYEKIGVTTKTYVRGENSGIYSMGDTFSVNEREKIRQGSERFYKIFKTKVSEGRELDVDSVQTIAQGRVWLGRDAVQIGLADTIGGFIEALDYLMDESDVYRREVEIVMLPGSDIFNIADLADLAISKIPFVDKIQEIPDFPFEDGEVLYLMPYIIEIK